MANGNMAFNGNNLVSFGNPVPPDVFFGKFGGEYQNLDNKLMNNITYYNYLYDFMNLYMSVFEWKNLPEGCDERMLEWWLMFNGFVGFIHDDLLEKAAPEEAPLGYAVMQLMLQGQMNMYQLPKDYRSYCVDPNVPNLMLDKSNCVICFDNQIRISPFAKLSMYASRLSNIERSIDVNVAQQKTPKIIKCNEAVKLSLENFMKKVAENAFYIMADDRLDLTSIEVLDNTSPYVGGDLNTLKHQITNECLTFCGIENTNTDKKERMITNEVMSNMGDVEAHRFTRLNPRKKAEKAMNEMLDRMDYDGLPVEVNYRAGVYIRTDEEGAIPTEGMVQDVADGEATGYDAGGSPNGLLETLRRLILG